MFICKKPFINVLYILSMKIVSKFILIFLFVSFIGIAFVDAAGITLRGNSLSYPGLGILDNTQNITVQNESLFIIDEKSGFLKAYFNLPDGASAIPNLIESQFPDSFFSNTSTGFLGDVDNFDSRNGFSRFKETNLNNGSDASSGFIGVNDIGRAISMGIGSSNFEFIDRSFPSLGALRLNSPSPMVFANDFFNGWLWVTDLNNGTNFSAPFTSMQLRPGGNLSIKGNFTVNTTISFIHTESATAESGAVRMFCKSDNNCYIKLSNGDERRLLDLPSGIGNFTEGSILFMGSNNTISEDNANFFWNDTSNRMGIGTQDSAHPFHIFDPQTIMAKFESSTSGPVGIQVSSGILGGDSYIRFTEGEEAANWVVGLQDNGNRFFIQNSSEPTGNPRFTIDAFSGFVGINTINPVARLHVADGDIEVDPNTTIGNQDVFDDNFPEGFLEFGIKKNGENSGFAGIRVDEVFESGPGSNLSGTLRFFTDSPGIDLSTERMTILGTGEVGIGNANPSFTFEVNGDVNLNEELFIPISGNVGIGTAAPQQRLHVSGGNIEIDRNFNIGSLDGFNVGALSGFINFGIAKDGFENRFSGMKVEEIQVGPSDDLFGTLSFFTDAEGIDFSTERMRITGLGNVGIGTTNPTSKLQVDGNVSVNGDVLVNGTAGNILFNALDASIEITRFAGIPFIDFKNNNSEDFDFRIQQTGNNSMNFESSSTATILFLDGLGNVGIGTTSPNFPLDLRGILSISAGSARIELEDTGVAGADWWILPSTGGNVDRFRIYDVGAAQDRLVIDGTGNVGIGTSSPTAKLNVIGNMRINGSGGVIDLSSSDGSIEITRLAGNAFIDFKNVNAEDFDFRINQDGVNSLNFQSSNAPTILFLGGLANVGIGTQTPVGKLNVIGDLNVTGDVTADTIFDDTIFAQLSSSVDQIPTTIDPEVITYNIQDDINRITHSTSVNSGELTITVTGTYLISAQPQVAKDSGGGKVDFDMFLQVDRNGTFVKEDNTNIKLTIKDSDITDVIVSVLTVQLDAGEKIRMMQRTSATGVGMGLKNSDPTADVPRTPSIIFTMYRIGG